MIVWAMIYLFLVFKLRQYDLISFVEVNLHLWMSKLVLYPLKDTFVKNDKILYTMKTDEKTELVVMSVRF